ncbi:MAG: LysM peptidoglycan-binding domain-containing protein [Pseudomonadota bacterium]
MAEKSTPPVRRGALFVAIVGLIAAMFVIASTLRLALTDDMAGGDTVSDASPVEVAAQSDASPNTSTDAPADVDATPGADLADTEGQGTAPDTTQGMAAVATDATEGAVGNASNTAVSEGAANGAPVDALDADGDAAAQIETASETEAASETEMADVAPDPTNTADGSATEEQTAALTDTTATEDAASAAPEVPSLDIVRVEPSGDAVFAGRAEPGWSIELRSGQDVVGSADVNDTGEWAVVTERPIAAGASDITLHGLSPDGAMTVNAPDQITVAVDPAGEGTPLVVLTDPDQPSRVLQRPETETAQAAGETDVASANAGVEDETVPMPTRRPGDEAGESAAGEVVREIDAAEAADGTTLATESNAALGTLTENDIAATTPETQPETQAETQEIVDTAEEAATDTVADTAADVISEAAETAVAAVDANIALEEGSADASSPDPTASAAVISDDAEESADLGDGAADAAEAAATDAGTAEATGVAASTATDSDQATSGATSGAASENLQIADDTQAGSIAGGLEVAIEAVESDAEGRLFISGSAEAGQNVRAYANNVLIGDTVVDMTGRWRFSADVAAKEPLNIRADSVDQETGQPTARAEVSFDAPEPNETIIALMPVPTERTGQPQPAGTERLIVRQGDNLWTIARELYGRGVRFTTIYDANRTQIRDPDLIYPGQVFEIPKRIPLPQPDARADTSSG